MADRFTGSIEVGALDRLWRLEDDGDWAALFDELRVAGRRS
jgi:hypothetical protein